MVSALKKVLDQYGAGDLDDASAVEKVKALMKTAPEGAEAEEKGQYDKYVDELSEDDNDYDDTWSEVEAALLSGKITQEQYDNLRNGTPGNPPAEKPEDA